MATLVQKELPDSIERVSHSIIGCAIEVHRELGPGLLESLYEEALVHELGLQGLAVARQIDITVPYKGIVLAGHRIDLIVEGLIIVEIKAIADLAPVHSAHLLSYLRATGLPLGLLLNFNETLRQHGLKRIFNERAVAPFTPLPASSSRPSRPSPPSR